MNKITILDWIDDCIGRIWCVVAFAFMLTPLFIGLYDPSVGVVTAVYCFFWAWRAHASWKLYKAARQAGKSREEWHRDEQEMEIAASAAVRERLRHILED